jgi:hypothetical protein
MWSKGGGGVEGANCDHVNVMEAIKSESSKFFQQLSVSASLTEQPAPVPDSLFFARTEKIHPRLLPHLIPFLFAVGGKISRFLYFSLLSNYKKNLL